VDFVAAKVLDAIGVRHDLITRWTGTLGQAGQRSRPDS
jgi:flavin prenyltransferase